MGLYINPISGEAKEDFLKSRGKLVTAPPLVIPKEMVAVCLVDNGHFTAAAVAYDDSEIRAFLDPRDDRPKYWYLLPKIDLREGGLTPTEIADYNLEVPVNA